MAGRDRPALRSTLLLTLYVACLCLVLSFILFEVLDIDGSDFPRPISRAVTVIKLTDPPHDFKRGYGDPPSENLVSVALGARIAKNHILQRHGRPASSSPSDAGVRRNRSTLARASLPDPAPSA